MILTPKLVRIHTLSVIPIHISMMGFAEIEKPTLKFIWILEGPGTAIVILKKKTKAGALTLPDFKT